jgi:sulfur carrier protein
MTPDRIDIIVNGRPGQAGAADTVKDLVESLGAMGPGLAVAVNDLVIRREALGSVRLKPGDRVEIIQAVGGGSF